MEEKQPSITYSKAITFTKLRIIKNLLIVSFSFLLLFTAFNGLSMLQSTMNKKNGIGTLSQAAIYIGFLLSSLILPKYTLKKLGCKVTLAIAMLLYIPYVAANFYPSWGSLIPAALFSGIGASILWGSQCTYFNISALLFCTASQADVEKEHKGVSTVVSSTTTSIETLSIKDIAFDSQKNIYCIKVFQKPDDDGNRCLPVISHADSVSTIKTNFDEAGSCTFFRRRSSGHEHGFFPPQELLSDIKKYVSTMQTDVIKNKEEVTHQKKSSGAKKSFDALVQLEVITPLLFGLHGLLYHSSMIWSNLMSYYILQRDVLLSNVTQHTEQNFSCACGAAFCNGRSVCGDAHILEPTLEMRYLLTGISVALGLLAVFLIIVFLDPLGSDKEPVEFSLSVLMATFNHGRKKEQIFLIPLSIYVGMEQGFYIGDYTKSYIACAMGTHNVGLVTIFYGITCALSSTLAGWIVRHIGRIFTLLIGQAINIGTNVYLLLWEPHPSETYKFFLGAFFWGIMTGIFWSQLPAFHGILFKGEEEATFAFYYLCSSIGFTIAFVCSDQICTNYKIYSLLAVSSLGIIGYLVTERLHYLKNKT